jgi:hypothetical protein
MATGAPAARRGQQGDPGLALQAFSADWNCGELVLMLVGSAGSTI